MKKRLMTLVKYYKGLYNVYYYLCSLLVNCMKLFVRTDDKLVLISCFGGKKYDDSPKVIFEAMQKDARFADFRFVWAFHEPEKFTVPGAKVIKTDTLTYFKTALKARCWITNSSVERGLTFAGKNTFYFNSWHGTPIKKMGTDLPATSKSFKHKKKSAVDVMLAQGDYEADIFSRVFNIERGKFLVCGLPRNDALANYTEEEKAKLKEKLGLDAGKKVILYAPTFREYERDAERNCVLAPPMDVKKWEKALGEEYCLLVRAHYEVANVMKIDENSFVRNVSDYPVLNDLMIVSDVLISDYSSIFFDFSIMDKVMLHFAYDYDAYVSKRGMYFDLREQLDGCDNEDALIQLLHADNLQEKIEKTVQFRERYVQKYGSAAQASLDCIYENIKGV